MKKLLIITLAITLLAGCGNKENNASNENNEPKEVATETEVDSVEEAEPVTEEKVSEYPFPANTAPIGEAMITISTPGGDSTDGNVPVLFVEEDDSMIQIGINYDEFDGSIETFVYINEFFHTKEQVGERSQSVLALSEDNLLPGEYTVTAVQFTDNDPTKEPINLTQAGFKIE